MKRKILLASLYLLLVVVIGFGYAVYKSTPGLQLTPNSHGTILSMRKSVTLDQRYALVDQAYDHRIPATIVYNPPERMPLGVTETLSLAVGIDKSIDDLIKAINHTGPVESGIAMVTPRVTATLSGSGFDIYPHSPESQAITQREPSTWKWSIKPNQPGPQHLHLALSGTVEIDGNSTNLSPELFERVIIIDVSTWQAIKRLSLGNQIIAAVIAGLFTAIILGIFRVILKWRRARQAKDDIQNNDTPPRSARPIPSATERGANDSADDFQG